jgi:hypothetical protein
MKKFNKITKENNENFFIKNKNLIIGILIGLVVGIIIMLMLWPKRIAKLANGEEPIVTIGSYTVTADYLYDKLKSSDALSALLDIIDEYLLKDKYDLEDEAQAYAEEQAEYIYEQYNTYYGYSKVEFLSSQGFEDEDEFLDYLAVDYYYQEYYDDYVKSTITDDDINDFYKDEVIGETKVVLFSVTDEDDESQLEKVRTALKKGTSVANIKKKYTSVTVNELTLTYSDYADYSSDLWTKIKSLNEGKYSEIVEDSILGYVVAYVETKADTPDLKDVKDDVVSYIVSEKQSEDSTLFYKAFIELRESYGISFSDTEMKSKYEDFVKNYK